MTYNVHFKLIPPTYESQMWATFRCQTWIIVQWLDLFWIQMDSWVWQTYESYACGSLKDREVCVTKQSNNSCFIQLLVELKDEACCHFWVHIKQETTFKCLILNIIQPKSVKKGVKRKKKIIQMSIYSFVFVIWENGVLVLSKSFSYFHSLVKKNSKFSPWRSSSSVFFGIFSLTISEISNLTLTAVVDTWKKTTSFSCISKCIRKH